VEAVVLEGLLEAVVLESKKRGDDGQVEEGAIVAGSRNPNIASRKLPLIR
jgi:hypothetical protein